MIRSLFTAATGMTVQQMEQDIIANNLANLNTVGFKKSRGNFQDLMYQIFSKAGATSSTGTQLPAGIEVGMGAKPVSTQKIFTQGDFQSTGNAFDWAIEGEGFFQIDDGNGATAYTRAGNFKLNKDGNICNSEGLLLTPSISVPTGTVVVTVDKSGKITATDSKGTMTEIGQIQIATFINPAGLTSVGHNLYSKTDASGDASVGNPNVDGKGAITQYFLEMSEEKSQHDRKHDRGAIRHTQSRADHHAQDFADRTTRQAVYCGAQRKTVQGLAYGILRYMFDRKFL